MKTLEDCYSTLEKLLNEEQVFLNPSLSFKTICQWLGTCPEEMDRLLVSELGLGGDELLRSLRESFPGRLLRKYGINVPKEVFF